MKIIHQQLVSWRDELLIFKQKEELLKNLKGE